MTPRRITKWTDELRKSGVVFTSEELDALDKHGARLSRQNGDPNTSPQLRKLWRKYLKYREHLEYVASLEEQVGSLRGKTTELARTTARLNLVIEGLEERLRQRF